MTYNIPVHWILWNQQEKTTGEIKVWHFFRFTTERDSNFQPVLQKSLDADAPVSNKKQY